MVTRMNISLPTNLVSRLKKVAPKRGISRFVAEATESKIRALEGERALRELLAAPSSFTFLKGKNAAVKWVRELRREDERRMRRIWGKSV